jgi:hypothetical protein
MTILFRNARYEIFSPVDTKLATILIVDEVICRTDDLWKDMGPVASKAFVRFDASGIDEVAYRFTAQRNALFENQQETKRPQSDLHDIAHPIANEDLRARMELLPSPDDVGGLMWAG